MSSLTQIIGKELEREINNNGDHAILLEEKHENYIAAVRKWEMLAATKVKVSGSEKTEWTGTQAFPTKNV